MTHKVRLMSAYYDTRKKSEQSMININCYRFRAWGFKNGRGIDQDDIIELSMERCVHPDDETLFKSLCEDATFIWKREISQNDLNDKTKFLEMKI
jgi:hypothetical protein